MGKKTGKGKVSSEDWDDVEAELAAEGLNPGHVSKNAKEVSDDKAGKAEKAKKKNKDKSARPEKPEDKPMTEEEHEKLIEERMLKDKLEGLQSQLSRVRRAMEQLEKDEVEPEERKEAERQLRVAKADIEEQIEATQDAMNKKGSSRDTYCILLLLGLFMYFIFFTKLTEESLSRYEWGSGTNFYEVLESGPTASREALRASYVRLLQSYHPDKNPDCKDCPTKFREVQEAWEVLSNASSRKAYDETNGVQNVIRSAAIELTEANFDHHLSSSDELFLIQIYENNCRPCEHLAGFWEELMQRYPFIRFARVNRLSEQNLLRRLPFGIRELPFCMLMGKNFEAQYVPIDFRGGIASTFKRFLTDALARSYVQTEPKDAEALSEGIIIGLKKLDDPVKVNYFVKKWLNTFGVKVHIVFLDSGKPYFEIRSRKPSSFEVGRVEVADTRLLLESIEHLLYLSFAFNSKISREHYNRFCQDRSSVCLLQIKALDSQILSEIGRDIRDAALKAVRGEIQSLPAPLLPFILDASDQPKFVARVATEFGARAHCLVLKNLSEEIGAVTYEQISDASDFTANDEVSFVPFEKLFERNQYLDDLLRPESFSLVGDFMIAFFRNFADFRLLSLYALLLFVLGKKLGVTKSVLLALIFAIHAGFSTKTFAELYFI